MKYLLPIMVLLPLFTIGQQPADQQKINNAVAFARLYGYVRYFHPSDEAAAINWEDFVYYGIKEVENERTAAGLADKLNLLFKPIAPSVLISTQRSPKFSVKAITPPQGDETKDIFWQHSGLGLTNPLYKSIRVNRGIPIKETTDAAIVTQNIDPQHYRGKRFRLRSSIKVDGLAGTGHMWISINNADGSDLTKNMNDLTVSSSTWQEYELTDTIPAGVTRLSLGAFVRGHGRAWVDNFILEIEEKGSWKTIPLVNPSFESPSSEPQGWKLMPRPGRFELVKNDAVAGNYALLLKNDEENATSIFYQRPGFGDCIKKDLGSGVSCIIPLVLKGSKSQTYPSASRDQLRSLEEAIYSVPSNKTAVDPYVRLSGITIAWNIFKHFFPYHNEAGTQWDSELNIAIEKAYSIQTAHEYVSLLKKMTEKLKDGHVRVVGPGSGLGYSIPAIATFAEGQIVIERVNAANSILKPGDIVTQIDQKPALDVFTELKADISGSEQWKNHRAAAEMFNGGYGSEVLLTIKRGQEPEKEIRLSRGQYDLVNDQPVIRKLDEDTYYINLGTTPMAHIERASEDLLKAKGLIFDLRGYPRNNNQIIRHLLSAPDTSNWMFIPQITRPDYEGVSHKPSGWKLLPKQPHITARIVFLTGGGAISQSESVMAYIKHHKMATIVGQPTAGANGDVNRFILPGNYSISFSGLKVQQHGGSRLHAIGIQPDVLVNRTIRGITEERDEYLEKAVEILKAARD